jgi:hypothetical protein
MDYTEVSREALAATANRIRNTDQSLKDVKFCAEALKHVRKIPSENKQGSITITVSSTTVSPISRSTWTIGPQLPNRCGSASIQRAQRIDAMSGLSPLRPTVGPVWRHSLGPWLRARGSALGASGIGSRGRVPTAANWRGGVIAGLAVTCHAMRRRCLGHSDGSGAEPPGRLRPRPASRGAHQLRSRRCAIAPGVDTHGGGLGGGIRGSTLTVGQSWWGGAGGALQPLETSH